MFCPLFGGGLLSCSNEEQPFMQQGNYITFASPAIILSEIESKAMVDTEEFPDRAIFGVLGYCLANVSNGTTLNEDTGPNNWDTKKTLSTPHVFCGLKVTKTATGCNYTAVKGTNTKLDVNDGLVPWYGESNFLYTFLSYYPADGWTIPAMSTTGEPEISYTVSDISDNPDLMVASNIDVLRGAGSVLFKFKHLMTGLKLRINNYDSGKDLDITKLNLTGDFHQKVKLSTDLIPIVDGTYYDTHEYGEMKVKNNENNELPILLFLSKADVINGVSANTLGENISLEIKYTSLQDGTEKEESIPFPDWTSFNPAPGVMYTLQLTFKGDAFLLDIVDGNQGLWEGGTGVDSDITFE